MAKHLRRIANTLEHGLGTPIHGYERYPQPPSPPKELSEIEIGIARPLPGQQTGLSLVLQLHAITAKATKRENSRDD